MNDGSRDFWDFGAHLALQLRALEYRVRRLAHAVAWCGIVIVVLAIIVIVRL